MRRYQSTNYKPRSVRRLEKRNKKNFLITIIGSLALLYFLLTWGLPLIVGSLTVLNRFKPNSDPAKSVSEDPAIAPPVLNIPYEATNTATIRISGYTTGNSQVEIYVDGELKDTSPTQEDGNFLSGDIPLVLGTNNIYGKTINPDNKSSLPSKTIKLIYSNQKPELEVTEPIDNYQVKGSNEQSSSANKKVRVSGKTDPENNVTVNGILVIVNNQGNFTNEIPLNDGDNIINIVATNSVGNTTTISRKVTYTP